MEDLPPNIRYWLDCPYHDCFFNVGPEAGDIERIGALQIFLKGHSEPMRAMFGEGGIAERGDVRLVDVEPETFKSFLKCIYGGSDIIIPKLNFEESARLLYVAEKYLVSDIKTKTAKHLSELLDPVNFFLVFSYPVCLQDDILKAFIFKLVQNQSKAILSDEKFTNLNCKDLLWILEQDLNIREIEIWKAVLGWGRKNCSNEQDLRSQMFPLLSHIRFLTMEPKEFWNDVVPCDVLSKDEVYELCKSFGTGISHSISNLCSVTCPRIRVENVLIKHLVTGTKCMSILCKVINTSKLQPIETSETFEWLGYRWAICVEKKYINGKYCLGLYLNCSKTGNYSLCVRNEFILIKGEENERFSFTRTYTENSTRYGRYSICESYDSLELILGSSVSIVANVRVSGEVV